jgi:hypothetical protein
MMNISFGVGLAPGSALLRQEDTQKFMDLVKMADDYGVNAIGTYDSAFLLRRRAEDVALRWAQQGRP